MVNKTWRPENWAEIKQNIVTGTPLIFSPSEGYSADQKDQLMEKAATAVLAALSEVVVTDIEE